MKSLIIMLFLCSLLADAQTLAVSPRMQDLDINHRSGVQLCIDSVAGLRAYSITLKFDTHILCCTAVRELKYLSSKYQIFFFSYTDTAKGTVRIDAAILGEGSVTGSGALVELQFQGTQTGTSSIEIVNTDFRTTGAVQPQMGISNGSIHVDVLSSVRLERPLTPSTPEITNYPNPFNPQTDVVCTMPQNGIATVAVYSLSGRLLEILEHGPMKKGVHSVAWNASRYPSGVYLAVVRSEGRSAAAKMMLIK